MFNKLDLLDTGYFIDNEYLDNYITLLHKNKDTQYQRNKTNNHHIIPVSYFKNRKIEVDNTENNKVTLLFKDHVLAHFYLYYCSSDKRDIYSNACAIRHLMGFSKQRSIDFNLDLIDFDKLQELYEDSKKYFKVLMKGRFTGDKNPAKRPEVREKISKAKMGHAINLITNRKAIEAMRIANTGKKKNLSEKGRSAIVENMINNNPMHNEQSLEKKNEKISYWTS